MPKSGQSSQSGCGEREAEIDNGEDDEPAYEDRWARESIGERAERLERTV